MKSEAQALLLAFLKQTSATYYMNLRFARLMSRISWIQERLRICLAGRKAQHEYLQEMFEAQQQIMIENLTKPILGKKKKVPDIIPDSEEVKAKLEQITAAAMRIELGLYMDQCRTVFRANFDVVRASKREGTASAMQVVIQNSFGSTAMDADELFGVPPHLCKIYGFG